MSLHILNELFLQVKRQYLRNLLLKELMKDCRMYLTVGRRERRSQERTELSTSNEDQGNWEVCHREQECYCPEAFKKFPEHGESTVRSFKQKYLSLIASGKSRPLVLGDFNQEVQKYIKALKAAGTAICSLLVVAAAQGIIKHKYHGHYKTQR